MSRGEVKPVPGILKRAPGEGDMAAPASQVSQLPGDYGVFKYEKSRLINAMLFKVSKITVKF